MSKLFVFLIMFLLSIPVFSQGSTASGSVSPSTLKLGPVSVRPKIEIAYRAKNLLVQIQYGDGFISLDRDFRLTLFRKKGKSSLAYSGPQLEDLQRDKRCPKTILQELQRLESAVPFCGASLALKEVDKIELQLGPKLISSRGIYVSGVNNGVPVVVIVF